MPIAFIYSKAGNKRNEKKVQIVATDTDKVLLNKTMSVYCDACNYVSDYVFRTHDLKQFSLNKILYSTLREKFSLKSQMAQSVFKLSLIHI